MRFQVKSMMVVVSMLLMMGGGLAFYDDFQIYNTITNPYFISNYSVNGTIAGGELVVSIGSAYNVFLQFHNTYAGYDDISGISLNYSKIFASGDFDFNISVLSGSFFYDYTNFLSVGYFVNNTDSASKDFKNWRGYRVIFTYYDSGNISATLCRNTIDILGCEVTLAYGSVILENHYGTGTTTLTVNNTIPIELYYNPATNLLTVYAGNHTLFTHTDTVYTSGGFVIMSASLSSRVTDLMLDNLSIYGISGVLAGSGWQVFSYPQNMPNWVGMAKDMPLTDYDSCGGGTHLDGTNYGINFQPCKLFYYDAYPTNELHRAAFVLKFNNVYWSDALQNSTPIYVSVYAHSTNPKTCRWSGTYGEVYMLDESMGLGTFYNGAPALYYPLFHSEVPYYRTTNPRLYLSIPFTCLTPENVTFQIDTGIGTPEERYTYVIIPIGYKFNTNGSVNYNELIDAGLNDTVENLAVNTPEIVYKPSLIDILFSNEMIGLGVIVVCCILGYGMLGGVGAFAASIIGIYVVVKFNLLPIWLFVIVIVAVAALGANAARELITGH